MLAMPISSPQITRMFGLEPPEPDGAVAGDGAAFCACASASEVNVAAATSVDVPSSRLRRSMDRWPGSKVFLSFASTLILHSLHVRTVPVDGLANHASEPDVAGRGVDRFGVARSRAIAAAIIGRAEMRAALQDFSWNADVRLAGIEARSLRPAARIGGNTAGFRCIGLVLVRPPV